MYKSRRAIFCFLLALVLMLGLLPEFQVRAEDNSQTYTVEADNHTHWSSVQNGIFRYAAGSMKIEGIGLTGDASQAAVAAGSGNLQLTVTDNTGYNVSAAQQKVAGAVSAQAVELDLNQIVAKGDGTNWETQITEFTHPITLSLGISNYDANYDYVVVRDHNSTTTALDTRVIDGKVTFETNRFSTYVIVKKEKSTAGSGNDSDGSDGNSTAAQPATQAGIQEMDAVPKTGENIGSYGMEMVLFLGGIVLGYMGILLNRKSEDGK